ncbi:MAG TPA: hypothetical protein VFD33_04980, partial [Bacillota bacterium]|nr:hypothetical protein [Bacillota bacterium]
YAYYNKIKNDVNLICIGPENCLVCDGDKCLVGHMKSLLNQCMSEETNKSMGPPVDITHKSFDKEKALESLILTLQVLKENPKGEIYTTVHEIRKHLEMIIFGKSISRITNWTDYQESILKIDDSIASSFLSNSLTDICTEEDANVE